ncbi:hypothetical protein RJ640_009102 [Escallonia rubra]|uniref:Pinin/SDK/MemA protein domain-containing protein n=1 Tax=Escallonia rubra TaxID=112253 RepID=A0AA88UP54_9ASTE|nr:hypothetical protein RJ640_009102 [Escallonia rubra]
MESAVVVVEKTEEVLRKELEELNRQQWELTERIRNPRGLRRGGASGPRNFAANGGRQRGFIRPAERTEAEDQPTPKRRLSSAVFKILNLGILFGVKVEDGEIIEDATMEAANTVNKDAVVDESFEVVDIAKQDDGAPSNWNKRDGNQRPSKMDFEIPPAVHVPRVLPKDEDPSLVKRNKRMLGQLLGTLQVRLKSTGFSFLSMDLTYLPLYVCLLDDEAEVWPYTVDKEQDGESSGCCFGGLLGHSMFSQASFLFFPVRSEVRDMAINAESEDVFKSGCIRANMIQSSGSGLDSGLVSIVGYKFREEDVELSSSKAFMLRSASLKKAEQRAREESERLRQQEREQIAEKRRRDLTLRARVAAKAEEKKLELLFLRWSEHHRKLGNFIRTKAEPQIYYSFAKPMEEDAALVEQRKEKIFHEWKAARREELSQYEKQLGEQYVANVEKEQERWQNARKGRKVNNDAMNLQETMDQELETHRLEHGPKTRKIPGGSNNEDEDDVEDINVEDDMLEDVLDVDDSRKAEETLKLEAGSSNPNPDNKDQ